MGTQQNEIPRCACGMPLMFSTRAHGGVLCGPCQRERDGTPAEADLARKEPQWSTEWPTEPGWYWVVCPGDELIEPSEVCADGGVRYKGTLLPQETYSGAIWLRIAPPDLDGARRALRGGA